MYWRTQKTGTVIEDSASAETRSLHWNDVVNSYCKLVLCVDSMQSTVRSAEFHWSSIDISDLCVEFCYLVVVTGKV